MTAGKAVALAVSVVLAALTVPVLGQNGAQSSEDQVKKGSAIYAQNCSPCHGPRMLDPQGLLFPPDQKTRFVTSVVKGKNQMPPYGNLFKSEDIDALWAYVIAGEKK